MTCRFIITLGVALSASLLWAQDKKPDKDTPAWAAEWRVTGIIRQGQDVEASMERSGLRPRFVREGDRLPGDIDVLWVNYTQRSVTLSNGREAVVLYAANGMLPPPPPPKVAGTAQQQPPAGWPNPSSQPTAMQDGNPQNSPYAQHLAQIDTNELPQGYNWRTHQEYVDQRIAGFSQEQLSRLGQMWKEKQRIDPDMPNRGNSFVRILEYVATNVK